MKKGRFVWGVSIVAVALVAVGAYVVSNRTSPSVDGFAVLATPPGITLQPLGIAQGFGEEVRIRTLPRNEGIALADARGMTLYTYDKDVALGTSACTGDCATAWPPVRPSAAAKPSGNWSIIVRDDGTRQWAYGGKPLYTYSEDREVGSVGGISPRPLGLDKNDFPIKAQGKGLPSDRHAALIYPVKGADLPVGIAIGEVADAAGLVLVDDRGMTLYVLDGDPNRDGSACAARPCPSDWTPVTAPQLAEPVGDFTVVARHDGIFQWAYKGKALYRYGRDLLPADAYGAGADTRHRVAQIVRYFMPPDVAMGQTLARGTVLTAAGMTLYRHDGYGWQAGGGHSLRHGIPIRPAVGRDVGIKGCDDDCLKTWHPLIAPADAEPSGYWSVLTRQDGSKQWAYQNFALYSYAGDKKPGDMMGNDSYDVVFGENPDKANEGLTPTPGTPMLFWTVAAP